MELILNCPNGNGVVILYCKERHQFIKSASNKGSQYLINEMRGFHWYVENNPSQLISKKDYKIKKNEDQSYVKIFIKEFEGSKYSPYRRVEKNIVVIKKIISHYFDIWKREDQKIKYPIHGDFSVGNCVFSNGEVIFFDWEHFLESGAAFGFDVVNLYYETIFFTFNRRSFLTKRQIRIFRDLKSILCDHLNCPADFKVDLNSLKCFLNENYSHWGKSFKKLPVLKFSCSQIKILEREGL